MEYRIVFKSRHEELQNKVRDYIDELLQNYGVHPKYDQKVYGNSVELRIESPIDGRKSLDKLEDQDDNIDLNKVYD